MVMVGFKHFLICKQYIPLIFNTGKILGENNSIFGFKQNIESSAGKSDFIFCYDFGFLPSSS